MSAVVSWASIRGSVGEPSVDGSCDEDSHGDDDLVDGLMARVMKIHMRMMTSFMG